jgi:hypothetical protein
MSNKLLNHYKECVDHYSREAIKAIKNENLKEFVMHTKKADMYANFIKNRGGK